LASFYTLSTGVILMTRHKTVLVELIAAAAAAVLLLPVEAAAQRLASAPPGAAAPKAIPRTGDGRPDMQGDWTNATYTPLERPEAFKAKEFFTPDEAETYARRRRDATSQQPIDTHYENAIWMTEKQQRSLGSLRTSIIVEPRDGRIPPLNSEGRRRDAARTAARKDVDPMGSVQAMELSDRCIFWLHEGPPILPTGYNSNLRIVQARDTFVVVPEMMGVARVVPLDARPRTGETLRSLRGESRGRWEGDTLVVETANFDERRDWRGASEALKVTERFTMLDSDTIRYEFAVEDPKTWDVPWKGEVVVTRIGEPIYEYACHEGNYGVPNILRGQRKAEADGTGGSR
jgi:hypothetical protein